MTIKNNKEQAAQLKADAFARLREMLPSGSTVYTVLRHVSASGMSCRIDLYAINNGQLDYLSGYCEHAGLGKRAPKKQGIIVAGCGMDMGFHLVHNLGYILYGNGYALKHSWV